MEIVIYDLTGQVEKQILTQTEKLLDFAAEFLSLPDDIEMSVTFVDNQKIEEINYQYRGINQPTDVLSFALEDQSEDEPKVYFDFLQLDPIPRNLGDLFISIEKAAEQAEVYRHSLQREYGFLTVHGFLHLNGYDHQNSFQEQEMFSLQEEILHAYGLERE